MPADAARRAGAACGVRPARIDAYAVAVRLHHRARVAALDDAGAPFFDAAVAGRLAELGMKIGAMTPYELARWLADAIK